MVAYSELNTQWCPSAPIIAGNRVIRGGNNLAGGAITPENRDAAMRRVSDEYFAHAEE